MQHDSGFTADGSDVVGGFALPRSEIMCGTLNDGDAGVTSLEKNYVKDKLMLTSSEFLAGRGNAGYCKI
jgi:hypothetical protein